MTVPNESNVPTPSRRPERRYKTRADVGIAMERLLEWSMNGTISPTELKTFQSALKSIAEYLPADEGASVVPLAERLKERMLAEPELLEDLSALIPREQLQAMLASKRS